jgi:subtilisin family serine protease
VVLGVSLIASPQAHGDVCVVVDPVIAVGGCTVQPTPPRSAAAAPAATGAPPTDAVATSSTAPERDPERIAVTVERGEKPREVQAAFANAGVEVEESIPAIRAYLLHVAPQRQAAAVRALSASAVIARAAPDLVAHMLDTTPNDSEWPQQDGLRLIGLPRAWDSSRGSSHLVVAIVDTGIDPNQPDLRGALVPGANLVDRGSPPLDDQGHGTAVSGIVAARADNGQGMAGVCWFCLVMPVKVLDSTGSGDDTRIAGGIVWAADHGARVINLSLGGPGSSPELSAALAYATSKGAVVVSAAGNSGTATPFFPAADANALSVAATTGADRPYSWSNYGSWVAVAAPGCNVAPARGGGYGRFCGTSSATPLVAGLAALALAEQPGATPAAVRAAIEVGTAPVPGVVRFGRVNAPQALNALAAAVRRISAVRRGTLTAARNSRMYEVPSAAGAFSATLRFSKGAFATLTLVAADDGTVLEQRTGRSPLGIAQPVLGPVRVEVHTRTRTRIRYALTMSYGGAAG